MSHLKTLIFGLMALLYSTWVSALGLGEIVLNSSLNEPLSAEVALLNIGDLGEAEMLVNLASKADFVLAGADRDFLLLDLKFNIDLSNKTKPIIRISSSKPIREPYLDFLIELQWSSGRLLREYTLFLDLPVFADDRSSSVVRTSNRNNSSSAKKKTNIAPASAKTSVKTPANVTTNNNFSVSADSYRVQSGDTLWGVASKSRPQDSSLQQTMQAIYERNAHAFVKGNMNVLRKGALLDIPGPGAIRAVDDQTARRRVAESAEELQRQAEARALVDSGQGVAAAAEPAESEGVLRLLSPNVAGGSSGIAGLGEQTNGELIENELAIAREEVTKSTRENLELREKIVKLEEQLATMGRLVELNDDQLSAMQAGLGKEESTDLGVGVEELGLDSTTVEAPNLGEEGPGEDLIEIDDEATVADNTGVTLAEGEIEQADDLSSEFADADAEAVVIGDESSLGGTGIVQETAETGLIATLRNNLVVIAGVLLIIVLGVFFLLSRRDAGTGENQLPSLEAARLASVGASAGAGASLLEETAPLEVVRDIEEVEANDNVLAALQDEIDSIGESDVSENLRELNVQEDSLDETIELSVEPTELDEDLDINDGFDLELDPSITDAFDATDEEVAPDTVIDLDDNLQVLADEDLDINDGFDLELDPSNTDAFDITDEKSAPDEVISLDDGLSDLGDVELDLELEAVDEDVEVEPKTVGELSEFDDFDIDADLDSLIEGDEVSTQLELAQAYLDMGDKDGAKDILNEVMGTGDEGQQAQAQELIKQIS